MDSTGSLLQLPMGQQLGKFDGKPKHTVKRKGIELKCIENYITQIYDKTKIRLSSKFLEERFDELKITQYSDMLSKLNTPKKEQGGILRSITREEMNILYQKLHDGLAMQEISKNYQLALMSYQYNEKQDVLYITFYYFECTYHQLIDRFSHSLKKQKGRAA